MSELCYLVLAKFRCFPSVFQKSKQPESGSHVASERMVTLQGGLQAIRDQPQTASQRTTTEYADIDHSGDRPVPAPPPFLEIVTYTEVGTKPVSVLIFTL